MGFAVQLFGTPAPSPRKGMPSPRIDEEEFRRRFLQQFIDPAFAPLEGELAKVAAAAWDAYANSRKAPRTRKAGPGFADPDYDLATDWIAARAAVQAAERRHVDKEGTAGVVLIECS